MPEETRVFDVSKPSKVNPSATSRPVIVGHHPVMNDPMVKEDVPFGAGSTADAMRIPISDDSAPEENTPLAVPINSPPESEPILPAIQSEDEHSSVDESPAIFSAPSDDIQPPTPAAFHADTAHDEPEPPFSQEQPSPSEVHHEPHIEGLHLHQPKPKGGKLKLIVLLILGLLVTAYLVIDSGLISSNINLPFHIFKQEEKAAPATSAPVSKQTAANTSSIPNGFKEYKLAGTSLTFAAPTAWGDPASTAVPGFSKRSQDTPQSDGTYAYVVSFSTNKNIEIAVTSSKYLPAARAASYYDNLQWCTGTNDGKIYQSLLHFSTAAKVDTPTTITCDQGPLTTALKINDTTIVQPKAQDAAAKVIGDIYTKNLKDPSLVVFRIKDAAMTNGTEIKQLLDTIQIPISSSSGASSNP